MILSELLEISKFTDDIASNDLTKSECASVDEMTFLFCITSERMSHPHTTLHEPRHPKL